MSICAAFALASVVGAPTPPAAAPTRPEELVRQLGDKSFRIRESAARDLVRQGSAAVAALTAGIKDTDPEVSERSRQLLPQAAAVERNEKLAQLVKDPTAAPPKGLAGLDRFLKATGDSKEARELYVELMSIHFRTLELAEKDPRAAAMEYAMFCNEAYNRYQAGARVGRYTYDNLFSGRADVTYLLFISSDNRLRQHENGINQSWILFNGTQLSKALAEKDGSPAMRKLFLDWLEKEPQSYLQQRGFQLAAQVGIKEALPVVLKLIDKKDNDPWSKTQAMTALVKLGSKEHIPVLDPYLKDTNMVTTINFGNGDQFTVQMRDVAMGVQIQLAGQKMTDYGYDNRFGGGWTSAHYYGFRDDKARDDAHAKWKEWASKNLKPGAKKDEPKEPEKKASEPAKPVEKK
jgi:HEAT repeat protein